MVFFGGRYFVQTSLWGLIYLKRASNMIKPLKKNMNFNARPKFLGVLCKLILGCGQPKKATPLGGGRKTPHSLGTNGWGDRDSSYDEAYRVYSWMCFFHRGSPPKFYLESSFSIFC